MKLYVEYCIAAASHLDTFEAVVDVPLKTALRFWRSTFAPRVFTSSNDTKGNNLLATVLKKQDPRYCYPVTAIHAVRLPKAEEVARLMPADVQPYLEAIDGALLKRAARTGSAAAQERLAQEAPRG